MVKEVKKTPWWKLRVTMFGTTQGDLAQQEVDRIESELTRLEKMAAQHEGLAKIYRDGVTKIRSGMPASSGVTPISRRRSAA